MYRIELAVKYSNVIDTVPGDRYGGRMGMNTNYLLYYYEIIMSLY